MPRVNICEYSAVEKAVDFESSLNSETSFLRSADFTRTAVVTDKTSWIQTMRAFVSPAIAIGKRFPAASLIELPSTKTSVMNTLRYQAMTMVQKTDAEATATKPRMCSLVAVASLSNLGSNGFKLPNLIDC